MLKKNYRVYVNLLHWKKWTLPKFQCNKDEDLKIKVHFVKGNDDAFFFNLASEKEHKKNEWNVQLKLTRTLQILLAAINLEIFARSLQVDPMLGWHHTLVLLYYIVFCIGVLELHYIFPLDSMNELEENIHKITYTSNRSNRTNTFFFVAEINWRKKNARRHREF